MRDLYLGNVIFPAPSAYYLLGMAFPVVIIAVLLVEWVVFCRRESGAAGKSDLLKIVIISNVISWAGGLAATLMMPTGLVPRAIDKGRNVLVHGPDYSSLAIMGLVIAYGLSVALEYLALRWIYQRKAWRSLFLTTWIANTVSYAAWFAVFFVIDSR